MSAKLAFVTTLAGVLLINGFSFGAVPQLTAKDTKKHDKKPVVTLVENSQRSEEHKKKDDEKKQQQVVTNANYQPALMKPASWRHFQQTHQRHRSMRNA